METIIEPKQKIVPLDVREIIRYRDLLFFLILRDIQVRYKQTALGVAWAVLQPVMMMVIFSVIFGRFVKMPREGYPYPLFVFAALLPWTFFANAVTACANSVVNSSNLITKVYFPRLVVPLASVGAGVVDFVLSFLVLMGLMALYGVPFGWGLCAVPILFLFVLFAALGIGTLLSALTAAYRDFRYVVPFVLQCWMYLTPVVYSPQLFPAPWRWLFNLNPMAGLIEGFRSAVFGRPLDLGGFAVSFAVSLFLFFIGAGYFRQVEKDLADIV